MFELNADGVGQTVLSRFCDTFETLVYDRSIRMNSYQVAKVPQAPAMLILERQWTWQRGREQ